MNPFFDLKENLNYNQIDQKKNQNKDLLSFNQSLQNTSSKVKLDGFSNIKVRLDKANLSTNSREEDLLNFKPNLETTKIKCFPSHGSLDFPVYQNEKDFVTMNDETNKINKKNQIVKSSFKTN